MLTIIDLKRNEELASSGMRKVAGGMDCGTAVSLANLAIECSKFTSMVGDSADTAYLAGMAQGVLAGGCGK